MNKRRLVWDFFYHAPDRHRIERHERLRDSAFDLAVEIDDVADDCREKSLAITRLEEAMFWAHAALAREGRPEDAE